MTHTIAMSQDLFLQLIDYINKQEGQTNQIPGRITDTQRIASQDTGTFPANHELLGMNHTHLLPVANQANPLQTVGGYSAHIPPDCTFLQPTGE